MLCCISYLSRENLTQRSIKVTPFKIKVNPLLIGKSYIVFYKKPVLEFCAYLDIIMINSHYLTRATIQMANVYSEIFQTSKMEHFVKVINCLNSSTIFAKCSILDVDRVLNKPLNGIKISLLTMNYYYCLYYSYCYLATKFSRSNYQRLSLQFDYI